MFFKVTRIGSIDSMVIPSDHLGGWKAPQKNLG